VPLTPEELRALVLYAAAIHEDDDQLLDYLPLLMSIMLEQPASVTEAFFRSGARSGGDKECSHDRLADLRYCPGCIRELPVQTVGRR